MVLSVATVVGPDDNQRPAEDVQGRVEGRGERGRRLLVENAAVVKSFDED